MRVLKFSLLWRIYERAKIFTFVIFHFTIFFCKLPYYTIAKFTSLFTAFMSFFSFHSLPSPSSMYSGLCDRKRIFAHSSKKEEKIISVNFNLIWGNSAIEWLSFKVYNRFYENVKMIIFRVAKVWKKKS